LAKFLRSSQFSLSLLFVKLQLKAPNFLRFRLLKLFQQSNKWPYKKTVKYNKALLKVVDHSLDISSHEDILNV